MDIFLHLASHTISEDNEWLIWEKSLNFLEIICGAYVEATVGTGSCHDS